MVFRSDGTSRSKGLWEYREGNWQRFGSDAKTYIANYNIDSSTTSWATYADAAGVVPVNGTGGVATTTFTFSSSSPLRGSGSGIITKDAANRQGEGISTDFTIDTADQGKVLQLSFDFTTSSAYVAADYRVFLYDVTNSLLIEGNARDLQANAGYGLYIGNFQTSSNSTSYRLILHCASTNASAYTIKVDNFILSPSQVSQGAIVTDWQSYTPTGSWSANTTYTGKYRRVGDSLELDITVSTSGAPTAANLTVNLPTGFVVDTTKISNSGAVNIFGGGTARDFGVDNYLVYAGYNSTTSIAIYKDDGDGTYSNVSNTAPFTFGASDSVLVRGISIPIVGWSSSITVPSQQTNQVIVCRAYRASSNQTISSTSATTVVFNTVESDSAGGFNTSTGTYTVPEAGFYFISAQLYLTSYTSAEKNTIRIAVNGGSVAIREATADSTSWMNNIVCVQYCSKGDAITASSQSAADTSYDIQANQGGSAIYIAKIQGNQTIGMDEVVACEYTTDAGQNINTGATGAVIVWDDRVYDTHLAMNSSTGVWTCPVAGKYLISYKFLWGGTTAWELGESSIGEIEKNSTSVIIDDYFVFTSASSIRIGNKDSIVLDLAKGDTIGIRAKQDSDSTQNLTADGKKNAISIARIK